MAFGHQFVLGELQRVGLGDQREQPALVHQVVHDEHLVLGSRCLELPALQGIPGRDVQGHPRGGAGAAAHGDPAADQGAEHGEEATALVLDRRAVAAVLGDVGVLVEQVLPRDAHLVELDAPVVDAGQTALVVTVRGGDTRQVVARIVADRHHEAVHAVTLALGDELSEHRRHPCRFRGIADVVLARGRGGGVDDELAGLRVVGGGGFQRLDVTAVTGLGHREAAQQLQVDDLLDVSTVMPFGTQVLDRAAEQAPLHACLDHQRQIAHGEHLDLGDRGADITVAAVLLLEAVLGRAAGRHDLELLGHLGAGDHRVGCVVRPEDLTGQFGTYLVLDIAPAAVERVAEMISGSGHS